MPDPKSENTVSPKGDSGIFLWGIGGRLRGVAVLGGFYFAVSYFLLWWDSRPDAVPPYEPMIEAISMTICCYLIYSTLQYYLPQKNRYLKIALMCLVLTAASLGLTVFLLGQFFPDISLDHFRRTLPYRFTINFLLLLCVIIINIFRNIQEEHEENERRKKESERMLRDAELYNLRQQLQPHFLFNSLNSIIALIGSQPEQARNMTFQLSDFLRGTMRKDDRQLIPLADEIAHLRLYLDIEKVRFGHRLRIDFRIREEANAAQTPCMIIQPLLENAIKFGLYNVRPPPVHQHRQSVRRRPFSVPERHGVRAVRHPPKVISALRPHRPVGDLCKRPYLYLHLKNPAIKMLKTIIIDDEPLARSIIRAYLNDHANIELLAECGDGFEGAKAIQQHRPDLVFLDVQMPKLTGFEMLEILDEPVNVIFTTAFGEFAIKAFEQNAVDYLMKPISRDRFEKALAKFQIGRANQTPLVSTEKIRSLAEDEPLERIVVKTGSKIKIIPVHQVRFLEAYDDYVKIHTPDGVFLKNKTMASFEKQLDPKEFVRVHRSFIVKVDQLTRIEPMEKESYVAILISGERVSISKSGYGRLREVLG